MKRMIAVAIGILLTAGAFTVAVATSSWEGDATGDCNGYDVLVDWVGCLDTQREGFDGYWGDSRDNDMYGAAYEYGSVWVVDSSDSYWDSDGWNLYYYGNWAGAFNENTENMTGAWYSDNSGCTDGDLEGEVAGSHCSQ